MTKAQKTNVMRLLDQAKINYKAHAQPYEGDRDKVFKTLVTLAKSGQHYVFVIPVQGHLDLKKAAKAVGEKAIAMIKEKELLPLTGYVHGGCSPIGMKKLFPTVFDKACQNLDTVVFSAGKVGWSVEVCLEDLKPILSFTVDQVTE